MNPVEKNLYFSSVDDSYNLFLKEHNQIYSIPFPTRNIVSLVFQASKYIPDDMYLSDFLEIPHLWIPTRVTEQFYFA